MAKSTLKKARSNPKHQKPAKPRRDFPLQPHANGSWSKRIKGKLYYFGPWHDSVAAEQRYHDTVNDIRAGRRPGTLEVDMLPLDELCDRFIAFKAEALEAGDIGQRSFADYYQTCELVMGILGRKATAKRLGPDDFQRLRTRLAKGRNPVSLGNQVRRARVLFRWAYDHELISAPLRFGQAFKVPNKKTMRLAREEKGTLTFKPEELLTLIDAADADMRVAILLGINGGMTNGDIAGLDRGMISDDCQWIRFTRKKTGVPREIPLWPETSEALQVVLVNRPKPKSPTDREAVFLTRTGQRLVRVQAIKDRSDPKAVGKCTVVDQVSTRFRKLLQKCGLYRARRNFYSLRHQFWTEAEAVLDTPAARRIMGHADRSIADQYREYIVPERLQRVTDHVRTWLFGSEKNSPASTDVPNNEVHLEGADSR